MQKDNVWFVLVRRRRREETFKDFKSEEIAYNVF